MGINLKRPPETFDGKQLITANALPEWCILNQAGRGDLADGIGTGPLFIMQTDSVETPDTLEFNFVDAAYVTSGVGQIENAELGDYIRFEIFAPPTVGAAAPSNNGNCNKYPTGAGFDIYIPSPGVGNWNLDLASADCHLVPNQYGEGFWDCDVPHTGPGTVTPNYVMQGEFDLYSIGMRLAEFATDIPILGTNLALHFGIENVRAKMIPPYWHWLVSLFRGPQTVEHTVSVAFWLQVGRARMYLPAQIPMV
jgi:hypothetical protein